MMKIQPKVGLAVLIGAGIWMAFRPASEPIDSLNSLSFQMPVQYREILYYASLAPSSHNAQMWQIHYQPENQQMQLYLDPQRILPQVDPEQREAYLSLGAFIETLRQAALAKGYQAEYQLLPQTQALQPVATFQLTQREQFEKEGWKLNLLKKRHTNKQPFQSTPLSSERLQTLMALLPSAEGAYYANNTASFVYLRQQLLAAMQRQAQDSNKRDELAQWLRYSAQQAETQRDGLSAEQLGIRGIKRWFYYAWVNEKRARGEDFAQEGIARLEQQLSHCAGLLVLTGGMTRQEQLRTGMTLQRIWLEASRLDIAVQPLSQLSEENDLEQIARQQLGLKQPIQIILRLGNVKEYGENLLLRRRLSEFVTLENVEK